ncbi:hypothetical protein GGI43DRAFT_391777 [Trichoderma evansii]
MVRMDVVAERNMCGLGLIPLGPGWFGLVPQLDTPVDDMLELMLELMRVVLAVCFISGLADQISMPILRVLVASARSAGDVARAFEQSVGFVCAIYPSARL